MAHFNGYRVPRSAAGGLYNGYSAPKAKQDWVIGNTVTVGFVKNLLVVAKQNGAFALLQQGTGRWYNFQPHMGLTRCDNEQQARAA